MNAVFRTKIVEEQKQNGETVSVYEKVGDQYRVVFPNGKEIWAYGTELEIIKEERSNT